MNVRPLRTFSVAPHISAKLEKLLEIAYNLHWMWHYDAIDLFRRLGSDLWDAAGHNPIRLLSMVAQETLDSVADDDGFMTHLKSVADKLESYMSAPGWAADLPEISAARGERSAGAVGGAWVAYFSAEFGLHECLPIYAGGLGVLAGDYLKACSDLGLPAVGVGILYADGYLHQYLNPDGWQQEEYTQTDFYNTPVSLLRDDGGPVTIEVPFPQPIRAQIWRAQVGRVPLLLLDTNLHENPGAAQAICRRLYEEGDDMRIQQEILLGIGGMRALIALGMQPALCHLNEGHAAFVLLEQIRQLRQRYGLSFPEAHVAAAAGNIFTTHTPVPAAVDRFKRDLVAKYIEPYINELGTSLDTLMALGSETGSAVDGSPLTTTVLAMRSSAYTFGVSRLHRRVSRRIWGHIWPGVPEEDVPISSATNGAHLPSWASQDMSALFDRYLGPRWQARPSVREDWRGMDTVPDDELWTAHQRQRQRLVTYARGRLRAQLERHGAPAHELDAAAQALDLDALTIVFARRFTGYKRATLLFRDEVRLESILNRPDEPVQIIYAGRAHPNDHEAKDLIKQIVHFTRDERFRSHVVFLENHDMELERYLVQGADVWLNTPRRPLEACGTSGMKAAANGALHVSILDGWWDEAYEPGVGWAIGRGEEYADAAYQDGIESQDTYDLLEREVIPAFYDRDGRGLPRPWIAMMKASISAICPQFNANRMVREYAEQFYQPASRRAALLQQDNCERARRLAAWCGRMQRAWVRLAIGDIQVDNLNNLQVGDTFRVRVLVELGELTPEDVAVDLLLGKLDKQSHLVETHAVALEPADAAQGSQRWFSGEVRTEGSGRRGFSVRILPRHEDLHDPYSLDLVLWS